MNEKQKTMLHIGISSVLFGFGTLCFIFLKQITNAVITIVQMQKIYTSASATTIATYMPYFLEYLPKYNINTPARICAFVAQVGHESGQLRYTEEIASGAAYEGRADLGNTQPGDGVRFKGRGLLQITGRANYQQVSTALGVDFVNNPVLLAQKKYAVESACWWWNNRGLNQMADNESEAQFTAITRKINGGTNGLSDRLALWNRAKTIITA